MVDVSSLLRVMPLSGLEPQWIGRVWLTPEGSQAEREAMSLDFLEPPAGQHQPYVDPLTAMTVLFRFQGLAELEARRQAVSEFTRLQPGLSGAEAVIFFTSKVSNSFTAIPASRLLAHLREQQALSADLAEFLRRAVYALTWTPLCHDPEQHASPWSLAEQPDIPPPKALREFFPRPPLDEDGYLEDYAADFEAWRKAIRSDAFRLAQVLVEPVYVFVDHGSALADEHCHRWLALHWWCTHSPTSIYIRFLVKVSGAADVEELKSALLDPASYALPFRINLPTPQGLEAQPVELVFEPDTPAKAIGVVFSTREARPCAQSLLLRQFAQDVVLWAPFALLTQDWCAMAMANCRRRRYQNLVGAHADLPLDFLARIDELYVVAENAGTYPGQRLTTAETIEDLLWLSLEFQLPTQFLGYQHCARTLNTCYFSGHLAPSRMRLAREKRKAFTQSLTEIRMAGEYAANGLWGPGAHLGFDRLDLPHPLMRRIMAWQQDWEDIPEDDNELRWEANQREETAIARELQRVLGPGTKVMVSREETWCWIEALPEPIAPA